MMVSRWSVALLLVAMACAVCSAQAQPTATVQTLQYNSQNCSGAPTGSSSVPTGVCNQGTVLFCSPDGTYSYSVFYSDSATCKIPISIQQQDGLCNDASGYSKVVCVNPQAGPSPPAFPPAGWITQSSCFNTSSYQKATGCTAKPPQVRCSLSASVPVACSVEEFGSLRSSCTADGSQTATLWYSSANCNSNSVIYAQLQTAGCASGQSIGCPAGLPPLPSLPTAGMIQFDSPQCKSGPGFSVTAQLYVPGTCVGREKFVCNNDGTASFSLYGTEDCTGVVRHTQRAAVDVCQNGVIFTCNYKKYQQLQQLQAAAADAAASMEDEFLRLE